MQWRSPGSVTATEPEQIQYQNLSTLEPVRGVGMSRGGVLLTEPTALIFTGFGLTGIIRNLRLRLTTQRYARIQDRQIQLWHSGQVLGDNLADLSAGNVHEYEWTGLNLTWTSDSGVIIDLQPHTQYPSANTVYVFKVQMASF